MNLTESFAMTPAASVCGLYFGHPESRYFAVDRITREQVESYAVRKGMPEARGRALARPEPWIRSLIHCTSSGIFPGDVDTSNSWERTTQQPVRSRQKISAKRSRIRKITFAGPQHVSRSPQSVLKNLSERFLQFTRHERGLAENTQSAYQRDLQTYGAWLNGRSPLTVTIQNLGDYLGTLSDKGQSRATIARKAATLRCFYSFLQLEGVLVDNPAEQLVLARRDDTIPAVLSASPG